MLQRQKTDDKKAKCNRKLAFLEIFKPPPFILFAVLTVDLPAGQHNAEYMAKPCVRASERVSHRASQRPTQPSRAPFRPITGPPSNRQLAVSHGSRPRITLDLSFCSYLFIHLLSIYPPINLLSIVLAYGRTGYRVGYF